MFENSKKLDTKVPFGFRDIFPVEAEERNNIKALIKRKFDLWGYGEIKTPVVEFTKNISAGAGKNWEDKLINFFDMDGSLVSLRTDMTIPIARFTAMRIRKDQLPVRFCYFANSFRQSGAQKGEKREYSQAGLELIGSSSFMGDVETLVILINILNELVTGNFIIGLGSADLIEALYKWLNLNEQAAEEIRRNLITKNYVSIREYLEKIDVKKTAIFMNLIKPEKNIKKIEEILKDINDSKVADSFKYLKTVYEVLQELDYSKYIIIDPGILRDFEYYTGLIFEVYSSNINAILGSGGRYDKLIKKFGLDVPATGFALDIDMLHKSMKESNIPIFEYKTKVMLYSESEDHLKLLKFSEKLRKENIIIETVFEKNKNLKSFAKDNKFDLLAEIDSRFEMINISNLKNDRQIKLKLNEFVKYIKNETNT